MKVLIAIALIATFLLPSCTKRYDCSCTFVDSAGNTKQEIIGSANTTKSKAKSLCDDWGNAAKSGYTSVSCHLQ